VSNREKCRQTSCRSLSFNFFKRSQGHDLGAKETSGRADKNRVFGADPMLLCNVLWSKYLHFNIGIHNTLIS